MSSAAAWLKPASTGELTRFRTQSARAAPNPSWIAPESRASHTASAIHWALPGSAMPTSDVPPSTLVSADGPTDRRVERLNSGQPNHVYEIKGKRYAPESTEVQIFETGLASWYGPPFHGRRNATGERYDMNAMTAAHKTMPLPSYALVRNPANGRQVVVKVNGRGPCVKGRLIDLSRAAARQLRIGGVGRGEVRRRTHAEIWSGAWKLPVARVASSP